jgi:hypothetical protein
MKNADVHRRWKCSGGAPGSASSRLAIIPEFLSYFVPDDYTSRSTNPSIAITTVPNAFAKLNWITEPKATMAKMAITHGLYSS